MDILTPIIEVLDSEARGFNNAKPIDYLLRKFSERGVTVSRAKFQQVIKPQLWDVGVPLAPRNTGMFVVSSEEDLLLAKDWYDDRIASEQANLDRIESSFREGQP